MAQKRMFDRSVTDSPQFFDLSKDSIALYFLLGMDADDEGFVNAKKTMRGWGFSDDALKLLISKELVIVFPSGVIVITDWKKNNWLDVRRITETYYKEEKAQVQIIEGKYALLSNRLATAKQPLREYSIEEYSIEENSIELPTDKSVGTPERKFNKKSDLKSLELKNVLMERFPNRDQLKIINDLEDMELWLDSKGKLQKDYKAFAINWIKKNEASDKIKAKGTFNNTLYPITGQVMGRI